MRACHEITGSDGSEQRVSNERRRREAGTQVSRMTCVVARSGGTGQISFYAPLVIARRAGCRRAFGCAHIAGPRDDVLSRSAGWSAKRCFIYILADDAARCAERHVGRHHDLPIPHDSACRGRDGRPARGASCRRARRRRSAP